MYELVCKSNSELKYWTSVLRQATALCASKTGGLTFDDDDDDGDGDGDDNDVGGGDDYSNDEDADACDSDEAVMMMLAMMLKR